MSHTEVLLCPILSPTPRCSRSPRRPCCSCRACWPSNGVDEAREVAGGRWAATGRRGGGCAGFSPAPGWPRWAPPTGWAADNGTGRSTAYRYLHEGIDVLAAVAPGLRGALLAARAAGHAHVTVDGTLIRTDRCRVPGPTARGDRPERRVDLWWSASTRRTAVTCRSSPHPMAGRCGPRACGPAGSTTPSRC